MTIAIPLREKALMAGGHEFVETIRTVVRISTSNGYLGYGEASGDLSGRIVPRMQSALVGHALNDLPTLRSKCLPPVPDFGTPTDQLDIMAFSAISMAVLDATGQASGKSMNQLIGGRRAEAPEYASYSFAPAVDPADAPSVLAERASRAIERFGSPIFEFKVGVHGVDADVESVNAVYKALPRSTKIAVDANQGYSVREALDFLKSVGGLLENFEEPTADFDDWSQLRDLTNATFSTHCADPRLVGGIKNIDAVVAAVDYLGGPSEAVRADSVYYRLGLDFWIRSYREFGIGWAAMVHADTARRPKSRPSQCLIDLNEFDIIDLEGWYPKDGKATIPERARGLGVEVDWPLVTRLSQAYEKRKSGR